MNGWTKPQVSAHLKDAWDDWAHRNASEWELDLSVLGIEVTDELLAWAKGRADRE